LLLYGDIKKRCLLVLCVVALSYLDFSVQRAILLSTSSLYFLALRRELIFHPYFLSLQRPIIKNTGERSLDFMTLQPASQFFLSPFLLPSPCSFSHGEVSSFSWGPPLCFCLSVSGRCLSNRSRRGLAREVSILIYSKGKRSGSWVFCTYSLYQPP